MAGRLTDKVAIITGGGSGIGRASAELFAREGAAVGVLDVRAEAAEETAAAIRAAGGRALGLGADVTSDAQVRAATDAVIAEFGDVAILYNNAGIGSTGAVDVAEEDDWDRCFNINAKGTFLCSRAVVPSMLKAGRGSIINQGSVAALVGVANFAAYPWRWFVNSSGKVAATCMSWVRRTAWMSTCSSPQVHLPSARKVTSDLSRISVLLRRIGGLRRQGRSPLKRVAA